MDLIFAPGRSPWVFKDKEATKVGAIVERDMRRGEALTAFDSDVIPEKIAGEVSQVQVVQTDEQKA